MLLLIKQKVISTTKELSGLSTTLKIACLISITISSLVVLFIIAAMQTRNVMFSYGNNTCVSHVLFLPDIFKINNNDYFNVVNSDYIKIGNINLFSNQTCFISKSEPKTGIYELKTPVLSSYISRIVFKLTIEEPPIIDTEKPLSIPLAVDSPLLLPISETDKVFKYTVNINNSTLECENLEKYIKCPLNILSLSKGKEYNIRINRLFDNLLVQTIIDQAIQTQSELLISSASVSNEQTLYDNTKEFNFTFNKNIKDTTAILTDTTNNKSYELKTTIQKQLVTFTSINELAREAKYILTLSTVIADDGTTLLQQQQFTFNTAGGPKFISSDAGTYGLSLNKTITLTFDQNINTNQNIASFIYVNGISSQIWKKDNKVYISYTNAQSCANISISINPGILNNYGFVQSKSWSINTKTLCRTAFSIGNTVEGRSIMAYKFGNGSENILFVGSIHGNEYSSKYLMEDWMDELERNYSNISQNKTLIVIPILNIDGFVGGSRYNSNGIDLNRNFPANDWQTDVYSLTNQLLPGAGGYTPLSEPESQALANLSSTLHPKLAMTFHSAAGYAIGNQAGNSANLAANYAALSGYSNMTGVSGSFSYPITGSYDDWLRDAHNITSVLIELSSNSSSQFSKNKSALWLMANS